MSMKSLATDSSSDVSAISLLNFLYIIYLQISDQTDFYQSFNGYDSMLLAMRNMIVRTALPMREGQGPPLNPRPLGQISERMIDLRNFKLQPGARQR